MNDIDKLRELVLDVHRRVGAVLVAVAGIYVRDVDPAFGPEWAAAGSIAGSIMLIGAMALLWLTEPKS